MVSYTCPRCGYETDKKSSMTSHFKRLKVCQSILDDIELTDVVKQNVIKNKKKKTAKCTCKFCGKKYSRSDNLKRHEQRCKERVKEVVDDSEEELINDKKKTNVIDNLSINDKTSKKGSKKRYFYLGHNPKCPDVIKIGVTNKNIDRKKQHQGSNPDYENFYLYNGQYSKTLENVLKQILREKRYKNTTEWFSIKKEDIIIMVDGLINVCNILTE